MKSFNVFIGVFCLIFGFSTNLFSAKIPLVYGSAITLRHNKTGTFLGVESVATEQKVVGKSDTNEATMLHIQRAGSVNFQAKTFSPSSSRWEGAKVVPNVDAGQDVVQGRDVVKNGDIIRLEVASPGSSPRWLRYDVGSGAQTLADRNKKITKTWLSGQALSDSQGIAFMIVRIGDPAGPASAPGDDIFVGDHIALMGYGIGSGNLNSAYLGATSSASDAAVAEVFCFADGTFNIPLLFDYIWVVSSTSLVTLKEGLGSSLQISPMQKFDLWSGSFLYSVDMGNKFNQGTLLPSLRYGDTFSLKHGTYNYYLVFDFRGGNGYVSCFGSAVDIPTETNPSNEAWLSTEFAITPQPSANDYYWGDAQESLKGKPVKSGDIINLMAYPGYGGFRNSHRQINLTSGVSLPNPPYEEISSHYIPFMMWRIFKKGGKAGDVIMPEDKVYIVGRAWEHRGGRGFWFGGNLEQNYKGYNVYWWNDKQPLVAPRGGVPAMAETNYIWSVTNVRHGKALNDYPNQSNRKWFDNPAKSSVEKYRGDFAEMDHIQDL